jgi:hypothetical protein
MPPATPRTGNKQLNPKQLAFADGVLQGLDYAVAYELAGYKASSGARVQASKLLRHPKVLAYIEERRTEIEAKVNVSAEQVLNELARHAFWDPLDIVAHAIAGPTDIAKLPAEVRRCITGWKWDQRGNFVIQFVDRQRALTDLAKYFRLYTDGPQSQEDSLAVILTAQMRFVAALHMTRGLEIAEAYSYAQSHPDEVSRWARQVGLLQTPAAEA